MSCMDLSDEEIVKIAEPMMDDIMTGVARREYKLHSNQFSVNLKDLIGGDTFLEQCDQRERDWGLPGDRSLISIFRKEKSFTLIWDQKFTRTDSQVMALVTVALKGGRYFVDYVLVH